MSEIDKKNQINNFSAISATALSRGALGRLTRSRRRALALQEIIRFGHKLVVILEDRPMIRIRVHHELCVLEDPEHRVGAVGG